MEEILSTVLLSAPVSAILLAVLVFILRNWIKIRLTESIKQEYTKDLESHKAILKKETEIELVNLNSKMKAQFDTQIETHKADLKARMDSELELLKARIQRRSHASKSQYDVELTNLQNVWKAISNLVDDTVRILILYDSVETEEGIGEKRKYAKMADTSFFEASNIVRQVRPFVPKNIHDNARTLVDRCKDEIDHFFNAIQWEADNEPSYDQNAARKEAPKIIREIKRKWTDLANSIRESLFITGSAFDENENI